MKSFNIHYAKTHFSALIAQASQGTAFVIAKAGKPVAKLVPFDAPEPKQARRIGFLGGAGFKIPSQERFDEIGAGDIEAMFGGDP